MSDTTQYYYYRCSNLALSADYKLYRTPLIPIIAKWLGISKYKAKTLLEDLTEVKPNPGIHYHSIYDIIEN